MGDLFDEFLRELDRRRAQAEGRAPRDDDSPSGDDPDDETGDDDRDGGDEESTPLRPRERRQGGAPGSGGPRRPVVELNSRHTASVEEGRRSRQRMRIDRYVHDERLTWGEE